MKKLLGAFLLSFMLLASSIIMMAQESMNRRGYTEDGIYYEVYFEILEKDVAFCADGVEHVTVRLTYDSIIVPPSTLDWEEEIEGELYSGTLKLQSYTFQGNKTIATYYGALYRQ